MFPPNVDLPMAEAIALPLEPQSPEAPSFETLVREHWEAVYRLAHSLTGNDADADDLAQDTLLKAWTRIELFRPGTNLRSWLLKVASNEFLDQQRRRKRMKSTSLDAELPGRNEELGIAMEVAERVAKVRKAMAELSELTRMVFHLRATEDLSFREIAEIAGTTEQSARWHMHHARTRLLELLGDEDDAP